MQAQTIFNRVVKHLRAQGKKSLAKMPAMGIGCAYRGRGGLKCAVGCLIKDSEYSKKMENFAVSSLFEAHPPLAKRLGEDNIPLLEDLQSVHDRVDTQSWDAEFVRIAARYDLKLRK